MTKEKASAEKPAPAKTAGSKKKKKEKKRFKLSPQRLGGKLKRIRLHFEKTQTQMLAIIHPNQGTENRARISQYEKNQRAPSLVEILNYADFAEVSVETLIDDRLELPDWLLQ